MKKLSIVIICLLMLGFILIPSRTITVSAAFEPDVSSRSSVLIERKSGKVLYENALHDKHPIASVTKLMTVLLTLERVDSDELNLEDKVKVSANASGMGGSQIFLDANQEYILGDLLKSVIVCSANDSSVALAEHIAGSENNFVRMMNNRAIELGMKDTNYVNCTGLPAPEAYSSAYDQAILFNRVLDFDEFHTYSAIWNEDFAHPSGRTTQMTNTNKLARFYDGCLGGKTGSTSQAKFCLAVGAKRGDMELISVVLGADSSKDRFKLASDLLNYGFDNFVSKTIFSNADLEGKTIKIKGQDREARLRADHDYTIVTERDKDVNFSLNYNLPNMLNKVRKNQIVGNVDIVVDGVVVDSINILSCDTHDEASIWDYFKELVKE